MKIHSLNVLLYALFLACFTSTIVLIGPNPPDNATHPVGNNSSGSDDLSVVPTIMEEFEEKVCFDAFMHLLSHQE